MNHQKYISPDIFVFSKWSRKEYAIFASLGKQIKIGVLKADICQKALLKSLVELKKIALLKEKIEEDENDLNIPDHDFLQSIFSLFGLSSFSIFNLSSISLSKEGNPSKNISQNDYKVCFLPCVENRLFLYPKFQELFNKTINLKIKQA